MEYNTIHCSRPQTVPYLQLPPPRRGTYTLELSRNKVSLSLMVLCALHVYRPCMHWTYCSHPALHIQLLHSPCKCYREKWSNTSLVVIIIHLHVLPETAVTIREYSFSKSQSVSPILTCYIQRQTDQTMNNGVHKVQSNTLLNKKLLHHAFPGKSTVMFGEGDIAFVKTLHWLW